MELVAGVAILSDRADLDLGAVQVSLDHRQPDSPRLPSIQFSFGIDVLQPKLPVGRRPFIPARHGDALLATIRIPAKRLSVVHAIWIFGVVLLSKDLIVLWIWLATVAYLLQDKKWAALDSPIAQAAGKRSYAVYIVHYPVLSVVLFVTSARLHLSGAALLISLTVLTIAGTLALSEFVHRWIERPGIRFGKWIGLRTEHRFRVGGERQAGVALL